MPRRQRPGTVAKLQGGDGECGELVTSGHIIGQPCFKPL
jgi:hypothetical protein